MLLRWSHYSHILLESLIIGLSLIIRLLTLGSSITLRIEYIIEMLGWYGRGKSLVRVLETWWNAWIAMIVARSDWIVKHVWAEIITSLTSSHTRGVLRRNSISSFAERGKLIPFGGRNILILLVETLLRIARRWLNSYIICCTWVERHNATNRQTMLFILVRVKRWIRVYFS